MSATTRRPLAGWRRAIGCAGLASAMALPGAAAAHTFDPGLLDVREGESGTYEVIWRPPVALALAGLGRAAEPRFPAHCRRLAPRSSADPGAAAASAPAPSTGPAPTAPRPSTGAPALAADAAAPPDARGDAEAAAAPSADELDAFRIECGPGGLAGAEIALPELEDSPIDAIVRIRWKSGETTTAALRAGSAALEVPRPRGADGRGEPARAGGLAIAASLGARAVATGGAPVLFALALALLIPDARALRKTALALALAECLTLGLAATGVAAPAAAPTQALIAASIALLAREAVRPGAGIARRAPWAAAFALGLLHGFGAADALARAAPEAAPSGRELVAFSAGLAASELALVGALGAAALAVRRAPRGGAWARLAPAYAIGAVAMAWTFQGLILCFAPGM